MVKNYNKYIKEAFVSKYNIHNFDVGDKVVVNDELEKWADIYGWGEEILKNIGKEFVIAYITDAPDYKTCGVRFAESWWWFPIQCLEPVKNVRWYYKGKLEK